MIRNGREIIRAGYAAGTKVADIARQCESTPGSVKVTAHRMGLRHRYYVSERVPEPLQATYRYFLHNKQLPAAYAMRVLGLDGAVR